MRKRFNSRECPSCGEVGYEKIYIPARISVKGEIYDSFELKYCLGCGTVYKPMEIDFEVPTTPQLKKIL